MQSGGTIRQEGSVRLDIHGELEEINFRRFVLGPSLFCLPAILQPPSPTINKEDSKRK